MPEYRVYVIGPDGHFTSAIPLECDNDETAIARAKELAVDRDVELWRLARKIGIFRAKRSE